MTACRVRRLLALAAAAVLALPAGVAAQVETEPTPLTAPDQFDSEPPAVTIDTPPPEAVREAPDGEVEETAPDRPSVIEAPAPETAEPGGISVGPLGELSSGSAGTLEPGAGGLDPDLWRDTAASRLITLFGRVPVAARSPAMHDLTRRLILSTAAPPDLDVPLDEFVAARLATLNRLGAFEDATELVSVLPGSAVGDTSRVGMQRRRCFGRTTRLAGVGWCAIKFASRRRQLGARL